RDKQRLNLPSVAATRCKREAAGLREMLVERLGNSFCLRSGCRRRYVSLRGGKNDLQLSQCCTRYCGCPTTLSATTTARKMSYKKRRDKLGIHFTNDMIVPSHPATEVLDSLNILLNHGPTMTPLLQVVDVGGESTCQRPTLQSSPH